MKLALFLITAAIFGEACKSKPAESAEKTAKVKIATFAADESCQPIVDELKYIFNEVYSNNGQANIIYKSENDVLRLLLNDKVRLALLSRELNVQELKVLNDKKLKPEMYRFAIDAITLIVNKASNDTLLTVSEIKKMLNGKTKTDKNIVFDNANSSLARYLKEFSANPNLKGDNIFALKNNKEVIKYVSTHTDAIGITGFSWLHDPDEDYKDAVDGVKIVAVKNENGKQKQYFKPSQTTLALQQYPLLRNLYIINNTGKQDLGTNFAYFILNADGQRVILKSGILPDQIPEREINIKHTF